MKKYISIIVLLCILLTSCTSYEENYPKIHKDLLTEYLGEYKVGLKKHHLRMTSGLEPYTENS